MSAMGGKRTLALVAFAPPLTIVANYTLAGLEQHYCDDPEGPDEGYRGPCVAGPASQPRRFGNRQQQYRCSGDHGTDGKR